MKRIIKIIIVLLMVIVFYLILSVVGVPVPFPEWYKKWSKNQSDSIIAHDPVLKQAKTIFKLQTEKDSLQHIVDSLEL